MIIIGYENSSMAYTLVQILAIGYHKDSRCSYSGQDSSLFSNLN